MSREFKSFRIGFFFFLSFILLLSFSSISFSNQDGQQPGQGTSQTPTLESTLKDICNSLYDYVALLALGMINLAAVVYVAGNFFGAETRARAHVWATSMLTGAIIGFVLILIVPAIIAVLLGKAGFDAATCEFTSPSSSSSP